MHPNRPFFSRNFLLIMLLAAFMLPFITRGARKAAQGNNNNVKDWLPRSYAESADLEWFEHHFVGEQFALVSWPGCELGNTEKLRLLAEKLWPSDPEQRREDSLFKDVVTGPQMLERLVAPPLNLGYREAILRLEGALIGPDRGDGDEGRITCLVATLSEIAKQNNRNKRRAMEEIAAAAADCNISPADLHMGGPPVDNVAIDIEGERTLYRLLSLSCVVGLGLSYWCFRSVRLTAMVFTVGAASVLLSLAVVYYYGLYEIYGLGLDSPRFGVVDAVLLTMPSVVYVLGLSGAIHIVNYYRDARRTKGLVGAPERALRIGWRPCALAAFTTAVGLASLHASDIIPIKKFGTFSAIGVLATLVALFTLLPALLVAFPPPESRNRGRPRDGELHPWMRSLAGWIVRRNGWVCLGGTTVMVLFGLGLTRVETSVQLLNLFDSESDIVNDYEWLEANLGELVPMEVVVRVHAAARRSGNELPVSEHGECYRMNLLERVELVRKLQKRIEALEHVGRALSAATFSVESTGERTAMARLIGQRRVENHQLEKHYDEMLDGDYLCEEFLDVSRTDAEVQEPDELWRVTARLGALDDVDYGEFVKDIRRTVEPVLRVYAWRDRIVRALRDRRGLRAKRILVTYAGPPGGQAKKQGKEVDENAPAQLLAQLLRESGAKARDLNVTQLAGLGSDKVSKFLSRFGCVVVVSADPRVDIGALAAANTKTDGPTVVDVSEAPGTPSHESVVRAVYTGVVPLVYKTQQQLLISLRKSLGVAFVLIAVVMMCVLQSFSAGLVSMVPNLFPIVVVFGALGWAGIKIDIGIMMTASVALGVAVDDTVHFLTWFRRGMKEGMDRAQATLLAYGRCGTAMTQTTIIGGLGLSVFAFSTFTPTQQFGILMITLLTAALVGDLIFLPAILAGPVGRFFSARLRKEPAAGHDPPPLAQAAPASGTSGTLHLHHKHRQRSGKSVGM